MSPVFLGVIRSGKLFVDQPEQFKKYLFSFPNEKRVEVTVEKLTHPRTNSQNRYYWGCVVKEIAQHTGHDPEQIHELLKQMFSPKWHMAWSTMSDVKPQDYSRTKNIAFEESEREPVRHDISIPTSTTRLDTSQFVDYTERCRLWANEFLGLQIPLPGEVTV